MLIKEDFPLPETPVIQHNNPSGISKFTFLRLFPFAPFNTSFFPFPFLLLIGISILNFPFIYFAVLLFPLINCFEVPEKVISPPCSPASGPKSTT